MRIVLALLVLQAVSGAAQACRFAQDAQPAQWHAWSQTLFAAEVTGVALDAAKSQDVITVRVIETFKGPEGAASATLQVPSRMWSSCALKRPEPGEHVLVALNPNADALLVPLSGADRARLRQHPRTAQ